MRYAAEPTVNHLQRYRRFLDSLEALRPGSQCLAAPEFVQHEGTDSIFFPSQQIGENCRFGSGSTMRTKCQLRSAIGIHMLRSNRKPRAWRTNLLSPLRAAFLTQDSWWRLTGTESILGFRPWFGSTITAPLLRCSHNHGLLLKSICDHGTDRSILRSLPQARL